MRPILVALTLALMPLPAPADVRDAIRDHILPGYEGFVKATDALALAAYDNCDPAALKGPFNAAWDAWLAVAHLHLGPVEEEGRGLAIAFWPDPKGLGAKAQKALVTADPATLDPETFADQSVAARGLAGLERLLYDGIEIPPGAHPCPLIRATAYDLERLAEEVQRGWYGSAGFGELLLSAGKPGNTRYLTEAEAKQALFTQLAAGLEFIADQRIGRPLGTFDKPRPERAEARLSGRALRNVLLSLRGLRDLALKLDPASTSTVAAFDRAITLAERLNDADFAGVSSPQGWLKVEILQQAVRATRDAALMEIAPSLGVTVGFNSQDGD